jgi:hypothetical protein
MRSVNKVIVLGHLGKDVDTKFTPSGVAVTKFSVATSRRWKDSQSDEWKEETDWHNIVLWRSENLSNYLTKGKNKPEAGSKRNLGRPVHLEHLLKATRFQSRGATPWMSSPYSCAEAFSFDLRTAKRKVGSQSAKSHDSGNGDREGSGGSGDL